MSEMRSVLASAYVLVLDRQMRALSLWSNTYGGFTLPGGKVEPEDPSPEHAAVRELMEETTLAVDVGVLRLVHKMPARFVLKGGAEGPTRTVHLFYARRVAGLARPTAGDRPLGWAPYDRMIATAPAFYADFLAASLPQSTGFAWLEPTEGAP